MLEKQIIVNVSKSETRVAIVERSNVAEIFIERKRDRSIVGDIYLGKVEKILPGMQSAFVDIGGERAAFLFAGDVFTEEILQKKPIRSSGEDLDGDDIEQIFRSVKLPIEKSLTEGKHILVQVSKNSIGSKGPRITMFVTIPGRYLVLMPQIDHVGISKRITDPQRRSQLKDLLLNIRVPGLGVIARTAAMEATSAQIQNDFEQLAKAWDEVRKVAGKSKAPALCYADISLARRIVRDFFTPDTSKIVIDSEKEFGELHSYLSITIPGSEKKLELYRERVPVFDVYGIELDIRKALERRFDLPSGGYVIVDQTEALTSFDVNTGRYVGRSNQNDTILRTNLEAVEKIAWQIRLRNLGGIIIIDFIDMDDPEHREQVYQSFQEALKSDRARTNVLKMSELGLLQMTRKRTSESLGRALLDECPLCSGKGRVKSAVTESYDLLRDLTRFLSRTKSRNIVVTSRDDIRDWILTEEREWLQDIARAFGAKIEMRAGDLSTDMLRRPAFEIASKID